MKALSPEELAELRGDMAASGHSSEQQDALIRLVDNIIASWIAQDRGLSSVKLTLSARANFAFNDVEACVSIRKSKRLELVDLDNEGAINTIGPEGHFAP